jgi:Ca2+-transporting ATPase
MLTPNRFGENTKHLPKIKSFLSILASQFQDLTLKILLVAATLTLVIGLFASGEQRWVEGASIYFAVALISLFTTTFDYIKEK